MSIKDRETSFSFWPNTGFRAFTGIREVGFNERGAFVVSAYTTPAVPEGQPRGTYFTSLPISPLEYRRKHGRGNEGFARERGRLTIWCDWGRRYVITAPPDILGALVSECEAQGMPNRGDPTPSHPAAETLVGDDRPAPRQRKSASSEPVSSAAPSSREGGDEG